MNCSFIKNKLWSMLIIMIIILYYSSVSDPGEGGALGAEAPPPLPS